MGVKLTNKAAEGLVEPAAGVPAETVAPAVKKEKVEKVKTSGVFLISSPDKKYKFVCTSGRIEICWHDYSKWLSESKHGNTDMQKAYDEYKGNLTMEILEECEKDQFSEKKKEYCKKLGVDMKVPFSGEVIKAQDIVV